MKYSLEQIPEIAKQIASKNKKVLTFEGPLGAGKTTLIKEILKHYNVLDDEVTSPTFTYLNIYLGSKKIYHFDLYRLEDLDDFIELGFDEYLQEPEAIVLIEWPEIIKSILFDRLEMKLSHSNEGFREITMEEIDG